MRMRLERDTRIASGGVGSVSIRGRFPCAESAELIALACEAPVRDHVSSGQVVVSLRD